MDYGKCNTTGKTTGNEVKNLQVITPESRTQKFLMVSFFRDMSKISTEAGLMRGSSGVPERGLGRLGGPSHEWSRNGYLKI